VASQIFQIDAVRMLAHQIGFTAAGAAADQDQRTLDALRRRYYCRLTQGLIAAVN